MSELYDDAMNELQKKEQQQEHANTIEKAITILRTQIEDSFSDENGDAWIYYKDNGKTRFIEVESTAFKDFIRVEINRLAGTPRENWVESIVKLFASEARRAGRQHIALRHTTKNGAWYLQINPDEAIVITNGTIAIVNAGTMFRNFQHQKPLDVDLNANIDDINLLDKYINFRDTTERTTFKITLPAYAIPKIPKPIQLSRGPPGSAKSTIGRVTKLIIDPSTARDGISYPEDERDWEVNCREHDIILLDNLSKLSKEQQDECCKIVTGKASNRRKLYTDKDSYTTNLKATILINAIELTDLNSDFLDRAMIWELARIDEDKRIPEEEFYENLSRDIPKIRGAIIQIIAKAQVTTVDSAHLPRLRLKDFGRWCIACATAMNIKPEQAQELINEKVELQKDESVAQSPIFEPLQKFMHDRDTWKGTATELLKLLTEQEFGVIEGDAQHEHTKIRNVPPNWFKTPAKLGEELSRISFLLGRIGLMLTRDTTGKKRTRILILQSLSENAVLAVRQPETLTTKQQTEDQKSAVPCRPHCPPEEVSADSRTAGGQQNKNCCPPGSSDDEQVICTEETVDFDNFSFEDKNRK